MFTVIIPFYNKAPYIEKAIRSVAAQSFQYFELIVIDDGSKDNGYKIVQDLFSHLTPPLGGWKVIQQSNAGVSVARNNGVKLAKYNYIAFLDADDWWAPNYLEKMKWLIERFPTAGIYGSSYFKVKNEKYIPANIGVSPDFQYGLINYFQVYANTMWMPLWTGATVIKKSIFIENDGFKSQLTLGEDFDLWVRVAIKYSVAFLNKPLAYYNQDVELDKRAVGERLYKPHEHMLFSSYDTNLTSNPDFDYLFQRLALYGLLKYYKAGVLKEETNVILSKINWKRHERKYYLYYKILSPSLVKLWFNLWNQAYQVKQWIRNR